MLLHAKHLTEVAILLACLLAVGLEVENLEAQAFVELSLKAMTTCVLGSDFALRVFNGFDNLHVLEEVDVARVGIEMRFEVTRETERALGRREDGLLHRLDEHACGDALFFADLLDDGVERNARALHD